MKPLAILQCLGKAVLRSVGVFGMVGEVAVSVGEQAWNDWHHEDNEQHLRAEVQQLVRMAHRDLRQHVELVVREIAADQRAEIRKQLSEFLEKVPGILRHSLARPDDRSGRSVPPDLPLNNSQDLICLLSSPGVTPMSNPIASAEVPVATVTLTLTNGPDKGRQYTFTERNTCILGRHRECGIHLPYEDPYRAVGRHHCILDINPPDVTIRDLGSKTGTYLNDKLIGKRRKQMTAEEGRALALKDHPLRDGDVIRLSRRGAAVFEVSIVVSPQCIECGAVLPEESPEQYLGDPGVARCGTCRKDSGTRTQAVRGCVQCGADVSKEAGAGRPGAIVCRSCRQNPEQILSRAQSKDSANVPALPSIQGYTIRKVLGRGGMGIVWLARHDRTHQEVAIKMMLPELAASDRAVTRALKEISNTDKLRHPNVVRLHKTGYTDGAFFLVLEYCSSGSVDQLIRKRGGKLPIDEAIEITLQALEGLHCAEQNHIVHRDLKPANVFLAGEGSARLAKVGDYGLAKALDEAGLNSFTARGEVAGTPCYMPRQQVLDFKNACHDVDVWAMAATLYKMLTGTVPRDFEQGDDPWMAILEKDVVPVRERNPAIPERLAKVIDLALQEEPEIPFKTAREFKDALEESL